MGTKRAKTCTQYITASNHVTSAKRRKTCNKPRWRKRISLQSGYTAGYRENEAFGGTSQATILRDQKNSKGEGVSFLFVLANAGLLLSFCCLG